MVLVSIQESLSEQRFDHNSWHKCGEFYNPTETQEQSFSCRNNSEISEEIYIGNFLIVCVYKINLWLNIMLYNKHIEVIKKIYKLT